MPLPDPDSSLTRWLDAIAAPTAAPAGGAAAALAGALSAALVEMVAGLTVKREKYASVHDLAARAREKAERLRDGMLALAARDARAFEGFTRALALPATTPEERERRTRAKTDALAAGTAVQLELLAHLAQVAELSFEIAEQGLAGAVGDAATGAFLALGAARSAYWSVRSNLAEVGGGVADRERVGAAKTLLDRVEDYERRARHLLEARVP
ncbi:MAG TPA: cyclodeaminase/cyclohydrolase family protein [Gemmatimonadales bacterium]|nr:cyclodeaminase/cyclohydrolase family protein [Gemmatimonadales bacterium]